MSRKLSRRQTATYNAALCFIHQTGHDPFDITNDVQRLMNSGVPASTAFQRALNGFVDRTPEMLEPLQMITRVIEASDDFTVARYNMAMSQYIETGDESGINAVAPIMAKDMVTLAKQRGEVAPEFTPQMNGLLAGDIVALDAQASQPQVAEASFSFAAPGVATE
jgi:hypothetical protein